jgi:2-oxoglutarate dehydrogenase E1 component
LEIMSSEPSISVFNDGYAAEMYESFRRDPASVDESWRQLFRFVDQVAGQPGDNGVSASPESLRKVAAAASLVQAIRDYGHLAVPLDPLGTPPPGAVELTPEFHGITEADLAAIPGRALGFENRETGLDVLARLRQVYSTRLAWEVWHLQSDEEREWFRQTFISSELTRGLSVDEKKWLLRRLTEVDGLERFLGRAYVGVKRFSIEGNDALVPMLDLAIEEAAAQGAEEAVIAMAHRGRINVLAHILDKPYRAIFEEFEGMHPAGNAESGTGDVKYHLGRETTRKVSSGRDVRLRLIPNPSHLEFAGAVLAGVSRATQRVPGAEPGTRDMRRVMPITVHGDAAFPGEGVVAESFNMSRLPGFTTGGTLRIIANNQVGFTTNASDARSTKYASDMAKGFDVPVVHVNADDAEACMIAVRIGVAYRTRFGKDFVIDLVGYRRHGHNEGDEPTYTQPVLYSRIKSHPTPREVWGARLVSEGVVSEEEVAQVEKEVRELFEGVHAEMKESGASATPARDAGTEWPPEATGEFPGAPKFEQVDTSVARETLISLNEQLLAWPSDFNPHPRLAKQLERRREALLSEQGVDWGHAEALAFASLVSEGTSVRLTGQDSERGTFSQRHAVLSDVNDGRKYAPLANIPGARGAFEVYNSPLTESAILGFEYGYSTAAADALVLWEAQFGDFVNVAQPIIDQFIVADRAKWGQDSGVVLLLPHGYEGQGPEHSSARLERFLQSCAEGSMRVAYPTTPAQYFHILRRQARLDPRRPLVLMTPKSLLRLPAASSTIAELSEGRFNPVLDDTAVKDPSAVRRLVLCSGKVFYDLAKEREAQGASHVALVRVEELYPWPHEELGRIVERYPNIVEVVWAQEEPQNMGAWNYVMSLLPTSIGALTPLVYVGRRKRASPAEGYLSAHQVEQARLVNEALAQPAAQSSPGPERKRKVGAR